MIDLLEIRNENRTTIGIIDTAKSIIWHSVYYGVGDFEIYVEATPETVEMLRVGYYVTRPNNDEVGIIEIINLNFTVQDGYMITASGRFAKSLLDRRIIYKLTGNQNKPTILRGNVEIAVRQTVLDNAINCSFDSRRNIPMLGLAALKGLTPKIVDENGQAAQKQVSYKNLMEYTDEVLQEYGMSANVVLNNSNRKLLYSVFQGVDRSADNSSGNEQIIFSVDFDNLNSSTYLYDSQLLRNSALIGGEGEGLERFYTLLTASKSGLQLREMFVNASDINKTIMASELQEAYPSGTFVGLTFRVNGVIYANLVIDNEIDYSLATLQDAFPSGTVSGTKFVVGGVTYATAVYGEDDRYKLTNVGYKAYLDAEDEEGEYEYTAAQYTSLLNQEGQRELNEKIIQEQFNGEVNVTYGLKKYGQDYFLGDIVTVQDNYIQKYINTRITEVTEVQDDNGYTVDLVFGE